MDGDQLAAVVSVNIVQAGDVLQRLHTACTESNRLLALEYAKVLGSHAERMVEALSDTRTGE